SEDVANRAFTGAVVEDPGPGADDGLSPFAGRVGEGEARRKVVVVLKEILPVVAQADVHGQIRPQPYLVLHEQTEHFLEERDVTIAELLREGVRTVIGVILQAGERE